MEITYEIIEQYTCGDCWVLALKLAEATGWHVAITDTEDHAFVISPDEKMIIDIRGVRSIEQFKMGWGFNFPKIIGNYKEALNYFSENDWGHYGEQIEWPQAADIALHIASQLMVAT